MKKRKLKGFVLPTLYMLITISIFTSIVLLGSSANLKEKKYTYGTDALKDTVESVIVEDEIASANIKSPVDDKVTISIHFYDKNGSVEEQQNSLIYFENTYLPNTGVLYTNDESFEVKTIFAGKVVEILDDEFFGQYVVVEHNSNLRTYYYGIDNLEVQVGDELTTGTVLGMSKTNEIMNNKKSFLLEVYHNNKLINPEKVFETKITDYK